MTDYSQNQSTSDEELRARIETLEGHVKEIGHTLYELIEQLHEIGPGDCPPMCPRSEEQESS